jgi:hypothetical protein
MNYCYEQFLKGFNLVYTTPISFLSDLTKFLKAKIVYFNDRTLTFLLDDFSVHRISESVQLILNPIIWDRQASHIFKLSAEKYGTVKVLDVSSESAPTADITREFREIDCGQFYIDLSDKDLEKELEKFAKELLDHRLVLTGYSGNTEAIIGYSEYRVVGGTLGNALKYHKKQYDQYHGLDIITQICSGDVSALLEIYRNIFKEGKVNKDTKDEVAKHVQHSAIVSVSGKFFNLIKTYSPFGDEMYKIVLNFGTLCHKILIDGKEMAYKMKDRTTKYVLCETTRIEVDQIPGSPTEEWTGEQERIIKELVRRAVFIEMEPSRGRATLGPTWRWQLRRIYCPGFGVGLKKYTAIKWKISDLKYFLTNPEEKCDFEKWEKPKAPLFEGLNGEGIGEKH